jgi:arylsulfatase
VQTSAAAFTTIAMPVWAHAASKPNIVLMVQDSLGWGEVGAYGGGILRGAETPNDMVKVK